MNDRDKAYFQARVSREMDEDLKVPERSAPAALAAACRILAREGHESGLAGQVTARGETPGTWWTLQFGYGFDEATPERMVLVDEDLKPIRGYGGKIHPPVTAGGRPNPGVRCPAGRRK